MASRLHTEAALAPIDVSQVGAHKEVNLRRIFTLCTCLYVVIAVLWLLQMRLGIVKTHAVAYISLLCTTWASFSIGMHVLNKTLMDQLHAPAFVSLAQMMMALTIMLGCCWRQLAASDTKQLRIWLLVPMLFAAMLCSSFYTYQYISLTLLTVVRNITPLASLAIERVLMPASAQAVVTPAVVGSIVVMVLGACMYAGELPNLSLVGVSFALLNMVLAVSDRCIQRRLLTTECKDMHSSVCTIMNNSIGMLPTLALLVLTHQAQDVYNDTASWSDVRVAVLLAISGFAGLGICYLGFECQRVVTASSFFVMQCVSKVAVVACGVCFFGDQVSSPLAAIGLMMSVGGSVVYGKIQIDSMPARVEEEKAKTPLVWQGQSPKQTRQA